MTIPKSFIKNSFIEIGRTIIRKHNNKRIEFYHKKLSWWLSVYGVRFKHVGYYIMIKKNCL